MAFGDSDEHSDDAGHWITIPYNGRPAVKLFFPEEIEVPGTRPVSLFWRGSAHRADLLDFARYVTESVDPGVAIVDEDLFEAGQEGVDGFMSFVMRGPDRSEIALWADLRPERVGMMTPEVGITLDAEKILGSHFLFICVRLMKATIHITSITLNELEDLIPLVMTKVQREYIHKRDAIRFAEN